MDVIIGVSRICRLSTFLIKQKWCYGKFVLSVLTITREIIWYKSIFHTKSLKEWWSYCFFNRKSGCFSWNVEC